jgi:hypothetical protein
MTARRGAPAGNKNALKHGYYSRDFPKTDLKDLEAVDIKGLIEEISLIRLHLRNLTAQAQNAPTLAEYLDVLRVINLLTSNLNRLVKTQVFLATQAPALGDKFEKILAEVQATWSVD